MVENTSAPISNNNVGDVNDVDMNSYTNGVDASPEKEKFKSINNNNNNNVTKIIDKEEEGDVVIPSPPEQKTQIDDLCRRTMKLGEKWYLVSCTWMRAFKKYCDSYEDETSATLYKRTHPGPINNTDIVYYG